MLTLQIPAIEYWNEQTEEFISIKPCTLHLEHSLVSVSKWEAKWRTAFLSENKKTYEQTIDYIRCMTITQNVDPLVYTAITDEQIQQVTDYINDPMTATTFRDTKHGSREIITSEIIYYWMTALNVPVEFQKWHLNRLLTFIRVCSEKNEGPKKMKPKDIMRQNAAINAARRAKLGSKG